MSLTGVWQTIEDAYAMFSISRKTVYLTSVQGIMRNNDSQMTFKMTFIQKERTKTKSGRRLQHDTDIPANYNYYTYPIYT